MAFADEMAEMAADISDELGIDVSFTRRDRTVGAGGAVSDTVALTTVKGVPSGEQIRERGSSAGGSSRIAVMTCHIAAADLPVGIGPEDQATIDNLTYEITQVATEAHGAVVVLTLVRDA